MFHISLILGWYVMIGMLSKCKAEENVETFTFKEFQYKDTPKNEMTFREFETACEQSRGCSVLKGLVRTHCVRECVSPSCYREIYQTDPISTEISMYGQTLFKAFFQYKKKAKRYMKILR